MIHLFAILSMAAQLACAPAWADEAADAQAKAQADAQAQMLQLQQQYQQQLQQQQEEAAKHVPTDSDAADARDMNELIQQKEKEAAPYKALNAVNPLAAKPADAPGAVAPEAQPLPGQVPGQLPGQPPGGALSPEQSSALQTFEALSKKPAVAAFATAMQSNVRDPEFMKALGTVAKNPNRNWMYLGLVVYTILFALLKRRAMAATDRWLPRMLLRVCFFVMFMGGYSMIMFAVLGDPIVRLVGGVGGAAWTGFRVFLAGK